MQLIRPLIVRPALPEAVPTAKAVLLTRTRSLCAWALWEQGWQALC